MFGPRLPVDDAQRAWVDRSLDLLTDRFGSATGWPTILPTAQYFPAEFDGSFAALRALLDRVAGWVHVDPADLDLEVFADPADDDVPRPAAGASAAGDYTPLGAGRGLIGVHRDDLAQPLTLVATIGHELAHHLLVGAGVRTATRAEDEGLTDLLTTHVGLGILAANAQRQTRTFASGGWSTTTLGYLSAPTYGYALARRALAAGEPDPAWAGHLATDPRGYLRASLRVLTRR